MPLSSRTLLISLFGIVRLPKAKSVLVMENASSIVLIVSRIYVLKQQ